MLHNLEPSCKGSHRELVDHMLLDLLRLASSSHLLADDKSFKNLNKAKCHLWQTMLILSRYVSDGQSELVTQEIMDATWSIVMRSSQHSSVRHYLQLFVASIFSRFPKFVATHLIPRLSNFNLKYQVTLTSPLCISFF